jgi:hypothetical protein
MKTKFSLSLGSSLLLFLSLFQLSGMAMPADPETCSNVPDNGNAFVFRIGPDGRPASADLENGCQNIPDPASIDLTKVKSVFLRVASKCGKFLLAAVPVTGALAGVTYGLGKVAATNSEHYYANSVCTEKFPVCKNYGIDCVSKYRSPAVCAHDGQPCSVPGFYDPCKTWQESPHRYDVDATKMAMSMAGLVEGLYVGIRLTADQVKNIMRNAIDDANVGMLARSTVNLLATSAIEIGTGCLVGITAHSLGDLDQLGVSKHQAMACGMAFSALDAAMGLSDNPFVALASPLQIPIGVGLASILSKQWPAKNMGAAVGSCKALVTAVYHVTRTFLALNGPIPNKRSKEEIKLH